MDEVPPRLCRVSRRPTQIRTEQQSTVGHGTGIPPARGLAALASLNGREEDSPAGHATPSAALLLETVASLAFTYTDEGYGRAVLARGERSETVAIHWPAGARSPLHGHGDSTVALRLLSGAVVEERFVAEGGSYRYERNNLNAGAESRMPAGSFHLVQAIEESYGIHEYAPALRELNQPVPPTVMSLLRQAWRRAQAPEEGVTGIPEYLR